MIRWFSLLVCVTATVSAAEPWPLLLTEEFDHGAERWAPSDPAAWKLAEVAGDKADAKLAVFSQFKKKSNFKPPVRSPENIALLKDLEVTDLEYKVRVKSTHADYGHRDVVLIFAYQDPAHFYYVHLAQAADDHANQIFIVDGAPRKKISKTTTKGTPWDDRWHELTVKRTPADGAIAIYFDDPEKPVMTAEDKTFAWGRVGLGTFDDTADFDRVEVRGQKRTP